MITGLVVGTQSMWYIRETMYRTDACEGVSRVVLDALTCLLLVLLMMMFPLPSL
jgi:hypothetical protein